jgi:signal transduction histidine kinase
MTATVSCKFNSPAELVLDQERTTTVFRIFQGMLTNVVRQPEQRGWT